MIQTAEGALNETHSILQRMRELAVQAANGTATDADRAALQDELNNLTSEINRIGNTTEFNTQKLLNGGIGSNDGDKITKATSAQRTLADAIKTEAAWTFNAGDKIIIDGKTFNLDGSSLDGATFATAADAVDALKNLTSGGVKLSELADISVDASGVLTIKSKSTGTSSSVDVIASANTIATTATTSAVVKGDPTLVERHGIEAADDLATANSGSPITINANSTFKVTVGTESAVTVTIKDAKTYDVTNNDANVARAAMEDLVKDLNAALQDAGLSDKVTVSLSKDNKVQFISETGKDITLTDGAGGPLAAVGFTVGGGGSVTDAIGNIQQVVGPGAQGSGYSTKFQIGANTGQSMSLTINDMRAAALGITGNAGQAGFTKTNTVTNGTNDIKAEAALNISTKEDASKAIEIIDKAIQTVSAERGKLGAVQNRLEHTINNLGTAAENLTAAESRIRDVDYALAA
ncbi:flagellin [Geobacillus thermodenitrificans]|nr:flagellin [Geobacillus thermodenitrificans]